MDIKGNRIRYTNEDMKNRLRVITTAEFIYLICHFWLWELCGKKNSCCYLYIRLIGGAADDPSPCQFQSRVDDCNVACIYNSIIIIVIIIARSSYSIYTWWSSVCVCVVCVCRAALTMSSIVTVVHHIIARRYISSDTVTWQEKVQDGAVYR